jgi:hypothetical protein
VDGQGVADGVGAVTLEEMPADSYRDAQVGIRARLVDLEARIREREAEVTRDFWKSLDPHVRERLSSLRDGLDLVSSDSFEELARAEGQLAAYEAELDRWIARLPTIEEEWLAVPDGVPDPPPEGDAGPVLSPSEGREFVSTFQAMVLERDRNAEIVVDGWWACLARFQHRGVPFALRGAALANGNAQLAEVSMQLVTSIPRATPRLMLRHETLLMAFGKALGMKHEIEVGDASFDGLFLIEGSKLAAARFLVPAIRAHLLALARFDVPTLIVDPPSRTASLRWRFEPAPKALDAAVRILTFIREAHTEVHFRKTA